jgi:cellulose synthase/poly-beta-1,6-N-acetylglucosamine synthase-like glycosyltransferase
MEVFWAGVAVFNYVVLAYFIALNVTYFVLSLFAFGTLKSYARRMKSLDLDELIRGGGAPPITVLAPAYNEEPTCVEVVRSLLTLEYPDYEIVVVNDGSKDRTLERLTEAFNLAPAPRMPTASLETATIRQVFQSRRHPSLWVVDKENGGKAD